MLPRTKAQGLSPDLHPEKPVLAQSLQLAHITAPTITPSTTLSPALSAATVGHKPPLKALSEMMQVK